MLSYSEFELRPATEEDIPALHALIEASVRGLQAADYTPAQIDGALGSVLGLDTQLIRDATYFVAESSQMVAPAAKPLCSTRLPMQRRFAPFLCSPPTPAVAWEP
jgi:hypothetical protein